MKNKTMAKKMTPLELTKAIFSKQRLMKGDVVLVNGEVYTVAIVDDGKEMYCLRKKNSLYGLYMTYMAEHLGRVGEFMYEFPLTEEEIKKDV